MVAIDDVPLSDACQFANMYAQPTCDIWSALGEFRDSIVAALTHSPLSCVSEEGSFLFNYHPKACHIVNVKDDDHLKSKQRPVYIALIMLIVSALMF